MVLQDIPMIPVFEPTLEEFENITFEDYCVAAEKLIDPNVGCFKVSKLIQYRSVEYDDGILILHNH